MLDPYYVGRLMPGKPVIGMSMKQAGYTTAHVGKWHVAGASGYPAPIQVGFDFSFDHEKHYNDPDIYDQNDPKQINFSGLLAQPKNRLSLVKFDATPDMTVGELQLYLHDKQTPVSNSLIDNDSLEFIKTIFRKDYDMHLLTSSN